MGHDGYSMLDNKGFYFANRFDWIMTKDIIIKNKEIPRYIYIKTDFLNKYVDQIMNVKNEFVLISGCSDFSPQMNFKESYLKIINIPNLKKWYTENNLSNHPKMFSLTVGFAHHTKEYEDKLLSIRKNIQIHEKKDKIFCCWRGRNSNVCGNEYIERTQMVEFVKDYPTLFDIYSDVLDISDFQHKLSTYKYCLCPLGNGVDCAPKIVECFFLKTIPIVRKTHNVVNLYEKYPVIFVDDFKDVLNMELSYDENIEWDKIIESFTCEHWFEAITN